MLDCWSRFGYVLFMTHKKTLILVACFIFLPYVGKQLFANPKYHAEQRFKTTPLLLTTNHLWLLPTQKIRINIGFETRSNWHAPLSGLQGRLDRIALIRADLGVSPNVVFQVRGAVRESLEIDAQRSNPQADIPQSGRTYDAGDFSIASIIRLWQNASQKRAIGFRIETKLPNSTQSKGIGLNTTDIHLATMLSQKVGNLLLFGDTGIGILTAPDNLDEQNDVLTYGLGFIYSMTKTWQIAFETNGFLTTRSAIPEGTEGRGTGKFVASWLWSKFAFELMITQGLTNNAGEIGWGFGLTRNLSW